MKYIYDSSNIVVIYADAVHMMASSDPVFTAVKRYLDSGGDNETELQEVIDGVGLAIAEFTGKFREYSGDDVVFSTKVEEVSCDVGSRMAGTTEDANSVTSFFHRLERNPSNDSRARLFAWLTAERFNITRDGMIVGYKGVSRSLESLREGAEDVTVTMAGGHSYVVRGHVKYPLGATVAMERSQVDANADASCSRGIHVGTHYHARNYGDVVLTVLVDPADVVTVPRTDCHKMRVNRVYVHSVCTTGPMESLVIDVSPVGAVWDKIAEEVESRIIAKLATGPLSSRTLERGFSKIRRGYVRDALSRLESQNRVKKNGNLFSVV